MPEMPEVESLVRSLRPQLIGRRLESFACFFPGYLELGAELSEADAVGRNIQELQRRAKLFWIEFEGGIRLAIHLGMSGQMTVDDPARPFETHTHLRGSLDDGHELRFRDPRRFGRAVLVHEEELQRLDFLRSLGPEALEVGLAEFSSAFDQSSSSIKARLLDQGMVAGLGNIYVDEILHRSGIHPRQASNSLRTEERARIHESMGIILRRAIEAGGSTIRDYRRADHSEGTFQDRFTVFGREGSSCLECGEEIRKIRLAGRGTHFCPQCQPFRRRISRPVPRLRSQ